MAPLYTAVQNSCKLACVLAGKFVYKFEGA